MAVQLEKCQPAEATGRMRTRFFPGLLLGSNDLTQDQSYFLEKHRRHNRMLHGWGVVCGVRVRQGRGQCEIVIEPGYILGPFGDEILVDREITVDLCREGLDGNAVSPCGGALDPWCSDVRVDRHAGQTLYVAIRYDECQTRPIRGSAGSCGCEVTDCEYSRIQDSYAIKALTRLPSTYDPMPPAEIESAVMCDRRRQHGGRTCSTCPTEPWVILADVRVSGDGRVDEIDCFRHRRYVVSFADYYFLCGQPDVFVRPGDIVAGVRPGLVAQPMLVDMRAAANVQPLASVAVRTAGGDWLALPVNFDVNPGETWSDLLAREHNREFFNPLDNEQFTLGELIAVAGIDADAVIESLDDVLLPMEGLRLNIGDLRAVRAEIGDMLAGHGIEGWERDHAGTVESLTSLPANAIEGVGIRSVLSRKLAEDTIGSIAGEERSAFINRVLEDVEGRQRATIERQARTVWTTAARIARRTEAWTRE